ncbi:acetyl-coa carboxylase 1 [Phtheirospermum japonicum]|uniref:Acetyl-coa carboxylase 1 n=1 Tax=Phtheirospermum japonicum TaxID=374723 RepID=A0A830CGQ8_9LAMI|nr:acetyl-coa carboxylase 1 [Phtheirospermum japonicum]
MQARPIIHTRLLTSLQWVLETKSKELCNLFTSEAAGTTTLSKSWYSAWLTRPNLDLDERNFNGYRGDSKFEEFSEFANKIIQRCEQSNLNIESFRICIKSLFQQVGPYESVVLPPELFEAGNFIGISVDWCKIHNIGLDRKDTRSFGAIAGLALAVVFTWRLLRAPRGPQRRQFKRQASSGSSFGVSNRASVNDASSEVSIHLEDSGTQNVIDEFFQPVKPTLSQIVRQMLCEGRTVTCRLLGVILDESSPEELQFFIATPFDLDKAESTRPKGHCVAVRVTIEDPDDGFKPTSGRVQELSFKSKPNVWAYFYVKSGGGIHEFSDPQFGKF